MGHECTTATLQCLRYTVDDNLYIMNCYFVYRVKMGREGTTAILEIDGAELSDAGEYTCILTNDAGKATSKAGLTVAGKQIRCFRCFFLC